MHAGFNDIGAWNDMHLFQYKHSHSHCTSYRNVKNSKVWLKGEQQSLNKLISIHFFNKFQLSNTYYTTGLYEAGNANVGTEPPGHLIRKIKSRQFQIENWVLVKRFSVHMWWIWWWNESFYLFLDFLTDSVTFSMVTQCKNDCYRVLMNRMLLRVDKIIFIFDLASISNLICTTCYLKFIDKLNKSNNHMKP